MFEGQNNLSESSLKSQIVFFIIVVAIVAAAIVRSSIATRLDSFTFDEAYHVGAGAAYVQTGDFRLNPEQPPLTKLWAGAYATMRGFQRSPYRSFGDKSDERHFVEQDAYFQNDPIVLQTETRTAMFALNGLLLFFFALAARRVFGDIVSIAATAFLAIDPTVAAHMPVVMTDLPIALTSGTAALLAGYAFKSWRVLDLVLAAAALGLALSAKHSGIITLAAVGVFGMLMAVVFAKGASVRARLWHTASVAAVVIGAIIVLWSFYMFRYNETPGTSDETFNRPLADKISDVKSPVYRAGLNAMTAGHLFPRAYIWGLADTIRAGAEGRAIPVLAFGELYYSKGPFYLFPGIVAVKMPIGLLLLSLIGAGFLIARRLPREYVPPFLCLAGFSALLLIFLILGSSYAGVRHALPLFPFMALLGAFAVFTAVRLRSYVVGGIVSLLFLVAIVSAVPQIRPWEYFNELAGGTANGGRYFNDEGVDLGQRVGEIAEYYHRNLEPNGEIPFLDYFSTSTDRKARGMDWVGKDEERDEHKFDSDTLTGTFIVGSNELSPSMFWDIEKPLRQASPIARFGNVFVFQGTFERSPALVARTVYNRALHEDIEVPEPNIPEAIERISRSTKLDPTAFFVALELGNQYLKLDDREQAIRAYRLSLEYAPKSDSVYELLEKQIKLLETEPIENVAPIRNPDIE